MAAPEFVSSDKSWLQIADASQSGLDQGLSDFSVSLMVYPGSVSSYAISKGGMLTWGKGYTVLINSTRTVSAYIGDGTASYSAMSTTALTAGAWNNVVVNFDRDGAIAIHINGGAAEGNTAISACGDVNSTTNCVIGARYDGAVGWMTGRLSHLRVWSRLLSLTEIARQSNMSGGVPYARPYSLLSASEKIGLVSAWELDEGPYSSTQQALDSHGINHLSFTASPIISPTVLNGGFETAGTGGADVFGSWTEAVAGSSTVNDETSDVYAGGHACRIDIDATNGQAYIIQAPIVKGKLYDYSFYAKASVGSPSCAVYGGGWSFTHTLSTLWSQYSGTVPRTASNNYVGIQRYTAPSRSIYLDNITLTAAEILTAAGPNIIRARKCPVLLIF